MKANSKLISIFSQGYFPKEDSEKGAGTLWAMLFCLIAVYAYLQGGQAFLNERLDPIYHIVVVVSVAVVALFTIGCTLHLIAKGDQSTSRLRNELVDETKHLEEFSVLANARIQALKDDASTRHATFRPHGRISLEMAQRIVNAISRRSEELNQLLATRNKFDIIDAHELMTADLEVVENCVDSLIAGDPIRPLAREDWFETVDQLISEVDIELERAAA